MVDGDDGVAPINYDFSKCPHRFVGSAFCWYLAMELKGNSQFILSSQSVRACVCVYLQQSHHHNSFESIPMPDTHNRTFDAYVTHSWSCSSLAVFNAVQIRLHYTKLNRPCIRAFCVRRWVTRTHERTDTNIRKRFIGENFVLRPSVVRGTHRKYIFIYVFV